MRISHNTFENGSKDSDSTNENNGLSADRVHTTSAHIPLREHVSVPMPPRNERVPLFPLLDNAEVMATELHVERQAPDADKTHQADGAAVLYERHIQAERERREQLRIEAQENSQEEDTSETEKDSESDSGETTEETEEDSSKNDQAKVSSVKHTPRPVHKIFEQPLTGQPVEHAEAADTEQTVVQPGQPLEMPQPEHDTSFPQPETMAKSSVEQQADNSNGEAQWPTVDPDTQNAVPQQHQVYGRAAMPVSSAGQPGSANQPPQPPMPPVQGPPLPPNFNNYPPPPGPGNPNVSPAPNNPYWNTYGATPAPNYNQYQVGGAPMSPNEPPAQYGRHKGVDTLARLGVVGNFIGNRRTRKRLGKQIEQNQQENATNFADIQARQLRFDQAQRQQGRDMHQLQQQPELASRNTMPQSYAAGEQAYTPAPGALEAIAPIPVPQPNTAPLSAQRPEQPFIPSPATEPMPAIRQTHENMVQPIEQQPISYPEQVTTGPNLPSNEYAPSAPDTRVYVNELQRERRHEALDDAAATGLGTSSYQQRTQYSSGQAPQYPTSLPSGMTTPTLPAGLPAHIDPQHQLPSKTKKSVAPGPAFWIMLALIVAAFFAAALI